MCKILTLTNLSKLPAKQTSKLISEVKKLLSETERDGFGYALQTDKGLFIERTTRPSGFKPISGLAVLNLPYTTPNDDSFGIRGKLNGAGMFHGRTSTNTKSLTNTHPLSKRDWTLIHNGVVSNHGPDYSMTTSNDTEHLLEYLSTVGIAGIEEHLTGYYAVNAIDPDGRLHVFRDSIAPLSIAWIETIESYVIATKESHVSKLCDAMKWKHSKVNDIEDDSYLVFELNDLILGQEIKPRGRTATESKYSSLSLGVELSSTTTTTETTSNKYSNSYSYGPDDFYSITPHGLDEAIDDGRYDSFSRDERLFLREATEDSDASYVFLDYHSNPMARDEFLSLDDETKLACTVIRGDGTIVDATDYSKEAVYSSRLGA